MPAGTIDSAIFRDIFGTEAMRQVWSDGNRIQKYLDFEAGLARAQAKLKIIPQEACDEITHFYSNYQSCRYIKDAIVLRVKHPVTEGLLRTLNDRFANICINGAKFQASGPTPEEENEPELAGLHRIVFPFNRTNFGRLRSLIDVVNQH